MAEVVKVHKCPICGRVELANKYTPFCSKRCADVDLGNWFGEVYTLPAEDLDDEEIEQLEKVIEENKD